jgi:hypothetical protein
MISPYTTRLLVKDLAGAKNYEAILMVFPKGEHLVPQQSNILVIIDSTLKYIIKIN